MIVARKKPPIINTNQRIIVGNSPRNCFFIKFLYQFENSAVFFPTPLSTARYPKQITQIISLHFRYNSLSPTIIITKITKRTHTHRPVRQVASEALLRPITHHYLHFLKKSAIVFWTNNLRVFGRQSAKPRFYNITRC